MIAGFRILIVSYCWNCYFLPFSLQPKSLIALTKDSSLCYKLVFQMVHRAQRVWFGLPRQLPDILRRKRWKRFIQFSKFRLTFLHKYRVRFCHRGRNRSLYKRRRQLEIKTFLFFVHSSDSFEFSKPAEKNASTRFSNFSLLCDKRYNLVR